MALVESLTIEIRGESQAFQDELSSVTDGLSELQASCSEVTADVQGMSEAFQSLSGAISPLQSISQMLSGVQNQLLAISKTPLTLDVSPAMGALQSVLAMAQAVGQQLALMGSMNSMQTAAFSGMGFSPTAEHGGAVQAFATGGYVTGPLGIDQVPARLTAGEFVLNPQAVQAVGVKNLDLLNRSSRLVPNEMPLSPLVGGPPREGRRDSGFQNAGTTQHFGGIQIHVRETADLSQVVESLQFQTSSLRNRRG